MNPKNYTPIDGLLEKYKNDLYRRSVSVSKEGEPVKIEETTKNPETSVQISEKTQEKEKNVEEFIKPVDN
jgi:hypothetical protein